VSDILTLLEPARRAVAAAVAVTRAVQADLNAVRRITKDDKSPVTVADFAAQAVVALRLGATLGHLDLIGEESSAALRAPDAAPLLEAVTNAVRTAERGVSAAEVLAAIDRGAHDASAEAYWTLDPVDGTKGFLRGGQYAISLAYIARGEVVLGVLGCPNLSLDFARPFDAPDPHGCLVHAVAGSGAWCVPADEPGAAPVRLQAASGRPLPELSVCESVEAGHSRHDETARLLDSLGARGIPARLDSQCKYAVVARGQADAYLRLPTAKSYVEKIWDHAAGALIAAEAGAIVTDIRGLPLDFGRGATLSANAGIICAGAEYHGALLDAARRLGLGD
jgi:3'(2'), 5'-bisphosphate nucleotidase